jgi:hypothetical protein
MPVSASMRGLKVEWGVACEEFMGMSSAGEYRRLGYFKHTASAGATV